MDNKIPISPRARKELNRLYRLYENGSISSAEYELRRREIFSGLRGIPQGVNDRKRVRPKTTLGPSRPKTSKDHSFIKKAFPVFLVGLLLIGVSFKVIPELNQKSSIIVSTIEKSVPKEFIPSTSQENRGGDTQSLAEPSNIPQISVPAPITSTSTINTPTSVNTQTNALVDGYISKDTSSHIFTVQEANSIVYKLQSELAINVPRSMSFGTPSIYGGEGIINTSVVKGGYYLFSDKPPKDSSIMVTVFVVEPGKGATFFKELNNYMSAFENAYNMNSTLYEKVSGPTITSAPSVQYQFNFYPTGDRSFKSNVRLIAIKKSNIVVYVYSLDNLGIFSSQLDKERKILAVLDSYK